MIEEVRNWLIKAYENFKAASYLVSLPEEEIPTGAVCFHCQQFVEKTLKAFLVFHKVDFGRLHNLSVLRKLCSEIDKDFDRIEVDKLTVYAVEVRYPDEFFIPSAEESRECFQTAMSVKNFVFEKLGVSESLIKRWIADR